MKAPFWGRVSRAPIVGIGSVSYSGHRKREDVTHSEMRRRPEDKEDDPFTASECQHAQSKLMCTAGK
jgi:hypothetical protein